MAEPHDVLTLNEARDALKRGPMDVSDDDTIARLITTATEKLEAEVGPIVEREVVAERHAGGRRHLLLRHWPLRSITTVAEHPAGADLITLDASDWRAEPSEVEDGLLSGLVERIRSGRRARWCDPGDVFVTYQAGRFATTDDVAARFREAALLVVMNLSRSYEPAVGNADEFTLPHQSFPGFAMPRAAQEMLADIWHGPSVA